MKLHVGTLFILFCFNFFAEASIKPGVAEEQQSQFNICKRNSLKLNEPNDRDQARLSCIIKEFPRNLSLDRCVIEAKKFEYLINEQSALRSCYYSKPQFVGINNCLRVAKELHSLLDRDDMRLDCVSSLGMPRGKEKCMEVANKFEQRHFKNKLISTCLEI